jgi:shikimate dehydrogenase
MGRHDILLAGVIGDPVAHSRSPAMHNAAFQHLGLDLRYERWHTPADQLAARIAALREPQFLGANVTLPHKVAVLELVDRRTPEVELIGAANTIVRQQDGTLDAYNTDAPAVIATLAEDAGFDPAGQNIVILGASGAARAAVFALAGARAARIVVVNRTLERAEQLLADLLAASDLDIPLCAVAASDPALQEELRQASLVVNATSLGWQADETPLDAKLLVKGALVFDMVYRPTRLLREAAQRGCATLDGSGMLVRQAALAFEHWTHIAAPVDVMWAAFNQG